MTVRHSPSTPVTTYQVQALIYYHWLVFCNEFTEIEAQGVWSYLLAGADGVINSLTPSTFVAPSGIFTAGHVGKYLAIKDPVNPTNNTIAKITVFTNSTTVQLNSPVANLSTSATGVSYRIIDSTVVPGLGNYFVIQNPVTVNQPLWQAKLNVRAAAPLAVSIEFAPIGGWDITNSLWTLPICDEVFMHDTIAQSFMLAEPEQGWVFFWTEDIGGASSDRKGAWFGSLSPFHAPRITGAASDTTFGAIFGDTVGFVSANFDRDTLTASNISSGQTMSSDTSIVSIYWAQKRLLDLGTDTSTLAGTVNPRSGEVDDYDMIAFQKAPEQAFRGRVPGIRLLTANLANRYSTANNTTYVIDNGIGVVWNGKTPV